MVKFLCIACVTDFNCIFDSKGKGHNTGNERARFFVKMLFTEFDLTGRFNKHLSKTPLSVV